MHHNMIFKGGVLALFCTISSAFSFGGNGYNCNGIPKATKYFTTIFGTTLSNNFACSDVLELAINATIDKVNSEYPELGKMGFICANYSQGADIGKRLFFLSFASSRDFSKKSS
jgi:hypothetical protein